MKYRLEFEKQALEDIRNITKSGRKSDSEKLESIFEELKETPTKGIGKPEPLKHHLFGFWSRRVNKKHRLVYQIIDEPDATLSLYYENIAGS